MRVGGCCGTVGPGRASPRPDRVSPAARRWIIAVAGAATLCGVLLPAAAFGSSAALPTTTTTAATTTTTAATTTTTAPQRVVNQPNLNALSPHIDALRGSGVQYQCSSAPSSQTSAPGVPSFLTSPGGPYLYDANNRVVLLHGVNVVYKHSPYIAYPDPGKPWDLSASDAARMQSLGFNIIRLGIEWQALEPGSGGPNQPKVCTPGTPGDPHEFNRAVAEAYLRHVAATVHLLSRYGIYTLLDMHQDVYNKDHGEPVAGLRLGHRRIVPVLISRRPI
jgi:aryl-phospho-beta-D-glucosidase BglC (GH1 family)